MCPKLPRRAPARPVIVRCDGPKHRWTRLKRAPSAWSLRLVRRLKPAVFFILAFLGPVKHARAAFQTPFLTPRSVAMGGASLPSEADSAALFVNPAGIGGVAQKEAYFSYTDLYAGLDGVANMGLGFGAAAFPLRHGTLGLGFGQFTAAGLMRERTLSVGWSFALGRARLGLAAKHLHHAFTPGGDPLAANDPVFRDRTGRGAVAFDVGAVVPVSEHVRLGGAVRNLNQPDVGLATEDRVRRQVQAGVGVTFRGVEAFGGLSLLQKASGQGRAAPALGLEKRLYGGKMAVRFGLSELDLSSGVGLTVGNLGFDYAWVLSRNLSQDNSGSHTVGVRVKFGGPR